MLAMTSFALAAFAAFTSTFTALTVFFAVLMKLASRSVSLGGLARSAKVTTTVSLGLESGLLSEHGKVHILNLGGKMFLWNLSEHFSWVSQLILIRTGCTILIRTSCTIIGV